MKPRTSESDPIRVDYLPVEAVMLRGRIGVTLAPGRNDQGHFALWQRDLDADLARLRDVYRTGMLVSLVEDDELALIGIADLVERAQTLDEVLRFPFADGGVPSSLDATAALVERIVERARDGRNVVIHCRGGLGRSGLVAACCLVALGHGAREAIAATRAARKGAIENLAQEEFVGRFAGAWRARSVPSPAEDESAPAQRLLLSRFRGCLLGGGLGDALGAPIEFTSSHAIRAEYGTAAPRDLAYARPGRALITDDTQMTLFTAEGVIRGIQRYNDRGICSMVGSVQRALVRWYATQEAVELRGAWADDPGWLFRDRRLHERRAPGNTCLSALAEQVDLARMPSVEERANDSKGCGGVMRVAPIGLAAGSLEGAFALARDSAALTHGHPSGYLSAAYLAAVVHAVARGARLEHAMASADTLLAAEGENDEMVAAIAGARRVAAEGPPSVEAIERLGGGWVGEEALAIGLACALTADASSQQGVADALWRAVAHSGDSDSTGSIAGNLLGAAYGVEVLPARWLAQLDVGDAIDRIAVDLFASAALGCDLDHDSYPST